MDGTPKEVFSHAQDLLDMGLDIPDVTRVFMELQKLGVDVPAVYTTEQAVAALRALKEGK
jgi:energy-coupling factor transport system ATP-binding protein